MLPPRRLHTAAAPQRLRVHHILLVLHSSAPPHPAPRAPSAIPLFRTLILMFPPCTSPRWPVSRSSPVLAPLGWLFHPSGFFVAWDLRTVPTLLLQDITLPALDLPCLGPAPFPRLPPARPAVSPVPALYRPLLCVFTRFHSHCLRCTALVHVSNYISSVPPIRA
ncbi:hypothetical protein DFH07DRAFT_842465 [Mycena maculata]|uniref:Uncharacterized protein n=1 Tax=Mycena maculata TaxID=230809 RepID=A0AAD7I7R7_9AGAR|nr:hypothetical protein DFH07DRAFT_842465 [Mycena maculata]